MSRYVAALCLAAVALLAARTSFAADDEQALYDEITNGLKAKVDNPQTMTREEFQRQVLTQVGGIVGKCDAYRQRFPKGAHLSDVCIAEANLYFFLASVVPNNLDKVDKAAEAGRAAVDADPKAENAARGRVILIRCSLMKMQLAKTPEEGAVFEAEAVKQAETVLADSPKSELVPPVLDFLAATYDRKGREKEATAFYERLAKEFPDSPIGQKAGMILKQRAFKGAVLELSFTSTAGEAVDIKNYRGKVVLVDFWASWSEPCKKAMPGLIEAEKQFRDQGFRVIGVSLDKEKAAMDDYVKQMSLPWPQFFDGGMFKSPLVAKYGIWGIPATFLVDKSGKVREISVEGPKLQAAIKKLLEEKTPE